MDYLQVRKFPFSSGEEGIHAVGSAGGTSDTDSLPRELCICISFKTDHATRSGRGHIMFPMPQRLLFSGTNFNLANSYFTTTLKAFTDALNAGADWGPLGADGHLSHVVYSRKDLTGYDVKSRIVRAAPRWLERRQTSP